MLFPNFIVRFIEIVRCGEISIVLKMFLLSDTLKNLIVYAKK